MTSKQEPPTVLGALVSSLPPEATVSEHFLATYGAWNIDKFVKQHSDDASILVVLVRSIPGQRAESEIVGETIETLWRRVREAVPHVAGHRASWGDLWFVVPGLTIAEVVSIACAASTLEPAERDFEIWCGVTAPVGAPGERLQRIDDLGSDVGKIRYREAYPEAYCILNGVVVHEPA
jgi:hypothetical protein